MIDHSSAFITFVCHNARHDPFWKLDAAANEPWRNLTMAWSISVVVDDKSVKIVRNMLPIQWAGNMFRSNFGMAYIGANDMCWHGNAIDIVTKRAHILLAFICHLINICTNFFFLSSNKIYLATVWYPALVSWNPLHVLWSYTPRKKSVIDNPVVPEDNHTILWLMYRKSKFITFCHYCQSKLYLWLNSSYLNNAKLTNICCS